MGLKLLKAVHFLTIFNNTLINALIWMFKKIIGPNLTNFTKRSGLYKI